MRYVRLVLLGEAVVCLLASMAHTRLSTVGLETARGDVGGMLAAALLAAGVVVSAAHPAWTRSAAVMVQVLAIVSTFLVSVLLVTEGGAAVVPQLLLNLVLIFMCFWGLTAVNEEPSKPVLLRPHWKG